MVKINSRTESDLQLGRLQPMGLHVGSLLANRRVRCLTLVWLMMAEQATLICRHPAQRYTVLRSGVGNSNLWWHCQQLVPSLALLAVGENTALFKNQSQVTARGLGMCHTPILPHHLTLRRLFSWPAGMRRATHDASGPSLSPLFLTNSDWGEDFSSLRCAHGRTINLIQWVCSELVWTAHSPRISPAPYCLHKAHWLDSYDGLWTEKQD